jgi:glycosyltransferase involved in cell wall biosynthesis
MKSDREDSGGPSSKPVVLHLVGGDKAQGGLMSYVRAITREPLPGFNQFVWMRRDYPPENESTLCLGRAKNVDMQIVQDVFGAMLDLVPLYLWLRKQNQVILYAHTRMGTLLSALMRVIRPLPVIVYTHACWRQTSWHRLLWRWIGATVIFNSRFSCLHFGSSPHDSHIMPPAIQWPAAPSTGSARFVSSSQILRWKNVHLIIEAFLQMAQEGQSLHVYGFLADTPPEPEYQNEVIGLARGHSSICMNQWDTRWTNSLRAEDVFVHAADKEPFGIVLLEAYARGCRMVVPRGTFLDELPSEGVFKSDLNSRALAHAMADAVASPNSVDLWQLRQTAARQFSLEATRRKLSEIYQALLRQA